MASVVKAGRTRRGIRYRVDFRDTDGKLFAFRGFDYKPAAAAVRAKVNDLEQLRIAGTQPDGELLVWVNGLKAAWQEKLSMAGLVDARFILKARPLWIHLLGFYRSLKAKGRTRKHYRQTVKRIIAILREADLHYVSDLSISKVEAYLAGRRDGEDALAAQSYNHYVSNAKQFSRWLMQTDRADRDPLANLKPLERAKVRKECQRERRAATPEEMRKLIHATKWGPQGGPGEGQDQSVERCGVSGAERSLVYWLAAMSGLRAKEIKSLAAGDFDFEADPATVTIRAISAKNSTTATIPLPATLTCPARPLGRRRSPCHMNRISPGCSTMTSTPAAWTGKTMRVGCWISMR